LIYCGPSISLRCTSPPTSGPSLSTSLHSSSASSLLVCLFPGPDILWDVVAAVYMLHHRHCCGPTWHPPCQHVLSTLTAMSIRTQKNCSSSDTACSVTALLRHVACLPAGELVSDDPNVPWADEIEQKMFVSPALGESCALLRRSMRYLLSSASHVWCTPQLRQPNLTPQVLYRHCVSPSLSAASAIAFPEVGTGCTCPPPLQVLVTM
jgi:hypothetical protein